MRLTNEHLGGMHANRSNRKYTWYWKTHQSKVMLNISLITDFDKVHYWVTCEPACNNKLNFTVKITVILLPSLTGTVQQNLIIPRVSGYRLKTRVVSENIYLPQPSWGHDHTRAISDSAVWRGWFIILYRLFVEFFFLEELYLQLNKVYSWYPLCFPIN
jgi:hypothetical protein